MFLTEMECSTQEMEFFHTFSLLYKKNLLEHVASLIQGFKIMFRKQEMECSKQEMELFPIVKISIRTVNRWGYKNFCIFGYF